MIKKCFLSIVTIFLFSGCAVKQVVILPLDVADAAITTTSNAVGLVGKVAKTGAEVGSAIIESSKSQTPAVNISVK